MKAILISVFAIGFSTLVSAQEKIKHTISEKKVVPAEKVQKQESDTSKTEKITVNEEGVKPMKSEKVTSNKSAEKQPLSKRTKRKQAKGVVTKEEGDN